MLQFYQRVLEMPVSFDSYKVGEIFARFPILAKSAMPFPCCCIRHARYGDGDSCRHCPAAAKPGTVYGYAAAGSLLLLLFALFTGPYRAVQRRYMEQAAKLEAALVETLGGISLIKAHTAEQEVQQTESKFNRVLQQLSRMPACAIFKARCTVG